jgi:hypothetical protein
VAIIGSEKARKNIELSVQRIAAQNGGEQAIVWTPVK